MNAAKGAERVELVGLGRCGLVADGEEIPVILAQPKRFGLLAYLVLARPRGMHQRDTLLALLWPELPEKNARQALAQSLYFIKQAIGNRAVTRRGRSLIGVASHVTADVERFEDFLAANEFERALDLYGGDLLPGLHVTGCRQFESWLESERSRLKNMAIEAAILHATNCEEAGRLDDAVHFAGWAVRHAPYDERAISNLFRALAAAGDVQKLHRAFESYEAGLREELEAAAPERIRVLYESALERAANTFPGATGRGFESDVKSLPRDAASVRSRQPLKMALGTLGTAAVAALVLVSTRPEVPAADVGRVVVLPLVTAAESPRLTQVGRIASDWVAREIARTGVAEVIAPRAASVGDSTRRSDSARFGGEAEGTLIVSGVVYGRGDTLVIEGVISEATSGRIAITLPELAEADSDPVALAEAFGKRVAGGLATALNPRFGRWAERASQPPSVEAYRSFLDGLDAFAAGEPDSADAHFLAAVREDTLFTAPLIWAIRNRAEAHRHRDADSLAQALESRRDELAPWDRAVLDYYTAYLRGTWEEAYQAARAVVHLAPDAEWLQMLASAAHGANRLEEAKAVLASLELDSGWTREWPFRWRTWTIVHHALGDFEAELAAAAPHRGDHPVSVGRTELGAFAGLGRLDDFESTLTVLLEMVRSPAARARLLEAAVDELRAHGHGSPAQPLADRAAALAESVASEAKATARDTLEYGRMLYLAERWDESYTVLSSISDEADVDPGRRLMSLGLAAARSGHEVEARSIADAILSDNPLDKGHSTQQSARILAALGDQVAATAMLRRAFEEGFGYFPWVHTIREFEALKGYPQFDALMKPRT